MPIIGAYASPINENPDDPVSDAIGYANALLFNKFPSDKNFDRLYEEPENRIELERAIAYLQRTFANLPTNDPRELTDTPFGNIYLHTPADLWNSKNIRPFLLGVGEYLL